MAIQTHGEQEPWLRPYFLIEKRKESAGALCKIFYRLWPWPSRCGCTPANFARLVCHAPRASRASLSRACVCALNLGTWEFGVDFAGSLGPGLSSSRESATRSETGLGRVRCCYTQRSETGQDQDHR